MKILDTYIDKQIGIKLLAKNAEERKGRKSSGKLSASSLGDPLQWQILKYLSVKQEEIDEYVIRKFKRGNDIEEWLIGAIDGVVETQEAVEYMGCIGYLDAMVDTAKWDYNKGIIPLEVKSVTNAKFRRIVSESSPQKGHILQACYYALGKGKEWFAIAYCAADDLRIQTYVLEVKDFKDEVDRAIEEFGECVANKTLPVFEAKEVWQSNKKYSRYPEWSELGQDELDVKAKELYGNL